jgi:hypothetical protein
MTGAAIGTGSISDQVNAVAMTLRQCDDLAAVEYRWPQLIRVLKGSAERAARVRRRGGEPAGLDGALAWLSEVVHTHPSLRGPRGAPMRQELLLLVDRIAGR